MFLELSLLRHTGLGDCLPVESLLPKIDADIENRLFDSTTFGERTDSRFEVDNCIEELSDVESPVICIDNFDRDKRVGASLSAIDDATNDALYITAWSP